MSKCPRLLHVKLHAHYLATQVLGLTAVCNRICNAERVRPRLGYEALTAVNRLVQIDYLFDRAESVLFPVFLSRIGLNTVFVRLTYLRSAMGP
jgi:hypothetical protein